MTESNSAPFRSAAREPQAKRGPGQPPFQPTEAQRKIARTLAGYGVPQDDIALIIGVDLNTLRKHLANELALGMAEANAAVAQSLFKQAIAGNTAAMIFWAKARMGWRETTYVDATLRSTPAGLASDADLIAIAFGDRTDPDDPDEPPDPTRRH